MYAGRDLAEVVELMPRLDVNHREVRVRGFEPCAVLVAAVGLDRKVSVHTGDDNVSRRWTQRTVNDKEVAVVAAP